MARISSYPYDTTVTDNDAWIGTEASSKRTKQFTAKAVAEYLNLNAKVNIGGQMSFKWSDTENGGEGTISKNGGGGTGDTFSTLGTVHLSINEINGQNVVAFLTYLIGKDLLLGQGDQISQFGHYKMTSYVVDPSNSSYYKAAFTYIGGNGTIATQGTQYTLIHFNIESGDKTFDFIQAAPASTWSIAHNLGKHPSVTVTDTGDTSVLGGAINYIDTNNLTITFSSAFAGKAFLN
jgi:hypothetical protein